MKSSIDLHLIRTFLTFCQAPSISESADRLGLSQPAVSQHLALLEHQFGQPLFAFQGRKKILTPAGQVLLEKSLPAWETFQNSLSSALALAQDPTRQTIRIGGRREILNLLPGRLDLSTAMTLEPMSRKQCINNLIQNKIELAVIQDPPNRSDLVAKKLFNEECVVACSSKWLAGRRLGEAIQDPVWLQMTPSLIYRLEDLPFIGHWWRQKRVEIDACRIHVVSEDWNILANLVGRGIGYCFIPKTFLQNTKVEQVALPDSKVFRMDFYAVYRKGTKLQFLTI